MSLARYLSKLAGLVGSDGKVPTSGIADAAVTGVKLGSGAAVANIGFTPVAGLYNTYNMVSRSQNTWYQAASDVQVFVTPNSVCYYQIYWGNATTGYYNILDNQAYSTYGAKSSATIFVPKGFYYYVYNSYGSAVSSIYETRIL